MRDITENEQMFLEKEYGLREVTTRKLEEIFNGEKDIAYQEMEQFVLSFAQKKDDLDLIDEELYQSILNPEIDRVYKFLEDITIKNTEVDFRMKRFLPSLKNAVINLKTEFGARLEYINLMSGK